MVALNKAEREGIIIKNPGKDIDHKLKPHAKESTRCYLTLEEVKKIIVHHIGLRTMLSRHSFSAASVVSAIQIC